MSGKAKNIKRYREPAHCLWCGHMTEEAGYIINPGGKPVLKCCCENHYAQACDFVARDAKARKPFWAALAILCLLNLLAIGAVDAGSVGYIPLFGIAAVVFIWPSLFTRYEFYARFGLVSTRRIFRVLALLLGVLAVFAMLQAR